MPFCGINIILNLSADWVISAATGSTKFSKADTNLYVPLSTQGNAKLLQELKSDFKKNN